MSYTLNFSLSLGPGKTGLTDLRAQLVDSSGANSGSAITTGFVEIGSQGFYLWNYASFADNFRGGVKFYSAAASSTILGFAAINPEEAEYTDAKVSTRLPTSSYSAPPSAAAIDSQLSGTHGAGGWSTATGFSTLTTSDIDARLAAYDAATGTEAAAILAAIAALNNLSSAGAQAAAAAALAAYDAATGADVTALAAILAVTNPDPDEPGEITIQRGTTIDREIAVEIIPASWTSARLTVKRYIGQADSEAVLQILVSATPSASDGLQILNGSADVTKSDASLTVTYATGKANFHLEDALTAALAVTKFPLWWDIKFYHGSSDSVATMPQHFNVTGIVTEAV